MKLVRTEKRAFKTSSGRALDLSPNKESSGMIRYFVQFSLYCVLFVFFISFSTSSEG